MQKLSKIIATQDPCTSTNTKSASGSCQRHSDFRASRNHNREKNSMKLWKNICEHIDNWVATCINKKYRSLLPHQPLWFHQEVAIEAPKPCQPREKFMIDFWRNDCQWTYNNHTVSMHSLTNSRSIAQVFPAYQGIAASVREKQRWQKLQVTMLIDLQKDTDKLRKLCEETKWEFRNSVPHQLIQQAWGCIMNQVLPKPREASCKSFRFSSSEASVPNHGVAL